MTPEDVVSLGWVADDKDSTKDPTQTFHYPTDPQYDQYIMSVSFIHRKPKHLVMINLVPSKTTFNEWENSETHFYGELETKEDLEMIMKFLNVRDEE